MSTGKLLRCYNKGCGKEFKEDDYSEDCYHHPGIPVFHDAYKGWSCCKKRLTDFTEFLNIPGCTKSRHSNVKPPEPEKIEEKPLEKHEVIEIRQPMEKLNIPQPRPSDDLPKIKLKTTVTPSLKKALAKLKQESQHNSSEESENNPDEVKPGTMCHNNACSVTYKNENSNDEKCWYHPGGPVFHEGYKFWTCCQKRTSDFDEFLKQEGCTAGTHRWKLTEEEKNKLVVCRYDWYQMGNFVVLSIYAKNTDPDQTVIEANFTLLNANIIFGEASSFQLKLDLHKPIDPRQSSVVLSPTKVEIKLRKSDIGAWKSLEMTKNDKDQS